MNNVDSFLSSYAKWHQSLIPQDAKMLRTMMKAENKISKWSTPGSVRIPGFCVAIGSVPVALVSAGGYFLKGLVNVQMVRLVGNEAFNKAEQDELSALKCLAIAVSSVALAIFSLILGAWLLSKFGDGNPSPNAAPVAPQIGSPPPALSEAGSASPVLSGSLPASASPVLSGSLPASASPALPEAASASPVLLAGSLRATVPPKVQNLAESVVGDFTLSVLHHAGARAPVVKSGWLSYVKNLFVNADDPWKLSRYQVSLQQLIVKVGRDKLEDLLKKEGLSDPFKKAIEALLHPESFHTTRQQFQEFQLSLRTALELAKEDEKTALENLCFKWFTDIYMLPFNYEMVQVLAEHGHNDGFTLNPEATLHEKFIYLLEGIRKLPSSETTPVTHVVVEKLTTITNYFDPSYKNMPSQWAEYEYEGPSGSLTMVQMRTCVPIRNSDDSKPGSIRPWEIEVPGNSPIRITPEYLAFLRSSKAQGKKILNIIHLDPTYYDPKTQYLTQAGQISLSSNNPLHKAKAREALWIALMIKLSKTEEFKGVFHAAVFPMDGDWLKKRIQKADSPTTRGDFIDWFEGVVTGPDSLFILPEEIGDKKAFVSRVTSRVIGEYFEAKNILNKEEKLAFYGLWCSKASEDLQIAMKIKVTQRNCKDAVDRTMALVGSELSEKMCRLGRTVERPLGQLAIRQNQEAILGTTLGPALGALKRGLLEERTPVLLATIKFLENHKDLREPSEVNGYRLKKVTMGQDPSQTLYPPPALAKTEAEYNEWLRLALENPHSLPPSLTIPNAFETVKKDYPKYETFKDQVEVDLPRMEIYHKGNRIKKNHDEWVTWLKEQGLNEAAIKRAMIAFNQGFLAACFETLMKLYNQPELDFHVTSPTKRFEFVKDSKTKKMKLVITAIYPIKDVKINKVVANIKVTLLVPLQSEKMPTYRWTIEKPN